MRRSSSKPLVAGFIVGTLDEWLQWVVPGRVGEMHDVLLNLVAVGCGVLFALALEPPPRIPFVLRPESRSPLARLAAAAVVVFALFFQSVHLGHEVVDPEAGVFRPHYTSAELAAASLDRSHSWRANADDAAALSWEDQYLSEGIAHVRRRNQRWDEGNLPAAWQEHRILEKYFAPVLTTPSYLSAAAPDWHDAQRAKAAATVGSEPIVYESDALPYAVFTWPKWASERHRGGVLVRSRPLFASEEGQTDDEEPDPFGPAAAEASPPWAHGICQHNRRVSSQ
jgi:hypothetical protein